ncbi:phospholipase D family protein [Candidatus Poribacteria bacterium]|nr:phospholipase D family protein [Candidatus Poribacteria bacterium]
MLGDQDTSSNVEFVITVPEPYGPELAFRARARTTLGVIIQLIAQAQHQIVIASPFIQLHENLESEPLAEALRAALGRGVDVDIVSTGSSLRALELSYLRQKAHGRLRLFQPRTNIEDERRLGSHAKFCLVDGRYAYIGSANLTGPGLSENLEMGVLIHGKIARQIAEFWNLLLNREFFVEIKTKD